MEYRVIQLDPLDGGMGLIDEFVRDYINHALKDAFNGKDSPVLKYEVLDENFGKAIKEVFDGENCPYIQEIYTEGEDTTYIISSEEISEEEAMKAFCIWEDERDEYNKNDDE